MQDLKKYSLKNHKISETNEQFTSLCNFKSNGRANVLKTNIITLDLDIFVAKIVYRSAM